MKLNFTVDLDDSEILGEEVLNSIKGEARKIAREEVSKEITSEIERIVKAWKEDNSTASWYEGKLDRAMRVALQNELKIDSNASLVARVFNEARSQLIYSVQEYVKSQMTKQVEEQVKEQLPQTIFDLLKAQTKEDDKSQSKSNYCLL